IIHNKDKNLMRKIFIQISSDTYKLFLTINKKILYLLGIDNIFKFEWGGKVKISEGIYIVGSGAFGISHERDCHVYLIKSGNEAALIDSGSGLNTQLIIDNIKRTGCGLDSIKYLFLTHAHADHACGVAELRQYIDCKVVTSAEEKRL